MSGLEGRGTPLHIEFAREVIAARKIAGRKIARAIIASQRGKLKRSGAANRRLRAVRSIVGRDGTLVMLDHAPLARAQERGETIRPDGEWLAVGKAGKSLGKPGAKIEGAFALRRGNKRILLRKTESGLELLAVLMKQIRVKKSLGFEERIEQFLPKYLAEIDKNLEEGFSYGSRR
jgi:hypothetical protein